MQQKPYNLGPLALTTALTTNILNPGTGSVTATPSVSAAHVVILKHIRVSNKTGAAATFSLWKGATGANAAGTEFIGTGINVPANSAADFYSPGWRFDVADFLVGGANTATALTLTAEGEIGVA